MPLVCLDYKNWEHNPGGEGLPPYFGDVPGAADPLNKDLGICLVDCNEPGQVQ